MSDIIQKQIPIEVIPASELSKSEFNERFFIPGKPVLIKGACEQWPARNWTLDNLKERVGDNDVYVRTNTQAYEYHIGTKYNIRQYTFGKYIQDIQDNNKLSRNSYLAVQNIKKAFPELIDDVTIPEYIQKIHGGPFLWIARKGHYEYCHTDADDGALFVMSGVKKCRLYGNDVKSMYVNTLGTKGRTLQSQVDCDNPDYEAHPDFANVTCHYCEVLPGDMLYIPAFWWHQITSPELTISVNIFWGNDGENNFLAKCLAKPIQPIFEHWILNIIEQNREYKAFQRNLERIHASLKNFVLSQWHDVATPDQIENLALLVKTYLKLDEFPPTPAKISRFPPPLHIRGLLWRG